MVDGVIGLVCPEVSREGFVRAVSLDDQLVAHGVGGEYAERSRGKLGRCVARPSGLDHEDAVPHGDRELDVGGLGLDGPGGSALRTLSPHFSEDGLAEFVVALEETEAVPAVVGGEEVDCRMGDQRHVEVGIGGDCPLPGDVDAVISREKIRNHIISPVDPPPHRVEVFRERAAVCERLLVTPSQELVGEGLVVAVNVECSMFEVVVELLHGPRGCFELGEACRIVFFVGLERPAEVGYGASHAPGCVLE